MIQPACQLHCDKIMPICTIVCFKADRRKQIHHTPQYTRYLARGFARGTARKIGASTRHVCVNRTSRNLQVQSTLPGLNHMHRNPETPQPHDNVLWDPLAHDWDRIHALTLPLASLYANDSMHSNEFQVGLTSDIDHRLNLANTPHDYTSRSHTARLYISLTDSTTAHLAHRPHDYTSRSQTARLHRAHRPQDYIALADRKTTSRSHTARLHLAHRPHDYTSRSQTARLHRACRPQDYIALADRNTTSRSQTARLHRAHRPQDYTSRSQTARPHRAHIPHDYISPSDSRTTSRSQTAGLHRAHRSHDYIHLALEL